MSKQQTAVQFLINYMLENFHLTDYTVMVVFDQAKEMEKEQMKNMWRGGQWSVKLGGEFEQYYNETYK